MEKQYKASQYNIQTTSRDGRYILIFNTRTGVLVQVPKELRENLLQYLKLSPSHHPLKHTRIARILMNAGCLVECSTDELAELEETYLKRVQRPSMCVSIMPTLACNMACIYCFEKHRNVSMTDQGALALLKFLQNRLAEKSHLTLDWYGGEPLLREDFIIRLQRRILNLCKSLGVSSSFSMTTNGVLLVPNLCDRLVSEGIESFQVTIDGPKQIHENRRPLKDGSSSFDRIVSNISHALQNVDIKLRVNVDRENISHLSQLLDVLKSAGLDNVKNISFKPVVLAGGIDTRNSTFSISEFANAVEAAITKAYQLGFNVYIEPRDISEFCPVDLPDQWIIDPVLNVYKCADAFDPDYDSVGRLNFDGQLILNDSFNTWRNKAIFEDTKCRQCVYLPQCMGGCSLKKLIHKKDWCPEERFAIHGYVQRLYESLKSGRPT